MIQAHGWCNWEWVGLRTRAKSKKAPTGLDVLEALGVLTVGRIWDDSFGLQAHTLWVA